MLLKKDEQRVDELAAVLTQIANGECTDLRHAEVIASAVLDEDLMEQLRASLEAQRRGDPTIPWSELKIEKG